MYQSFHEFDLSEKVIEAVSAMGFTEPTPIQKAAIPVALKGGDIVGLAQTGTGKTAAFGIPMIERADRCSGKNPCAIVLVPTRELAIQVAGELDRIGKTRGLTTLAVYGGQSILVQLRALKKGVDIVVGTPGRVIDHIGRKTLVLQDVRTVVLDEADEMLNMGFAEDMETILQEVPAERQTLLFSATMPPAILRIAARYMNEPETVRAPTKGVVVAEIRQVYYEVRHSDKLKALMRLLDVEDASRALVFCATKKDVDQVSTDLQQAGYGAVGIHGDYTQELRDETMKRFRQGEAAVLVATDVAARGLDIADVTHVVNFTVPNNPESYVHRIGRTGRAGKLGTAITLVSPREFRQFKNIERSARTAVKKLALPTPDQVRRARAERLIGTLASAIEEGRHLPHRQLIEELTARYSPEDMAAAALGLIAGDTEIGEIVEESRSVRRQGASAASRGTFVRLTVTLGRKDGISVGDLVRSIAAESRISGRDIGKIALYDSHSMVEIPSHLAEHVIVSLHNRKFKGRRIQVKPAGKRAA